MSQLPIIEINHVMNVCKHSEKKKECMFLAFDVDKRNYVCFKHNSKYADPIKIMNLLALSKAQDQINFIPNGNNCDGNLTPPPIPILPDDFNESYY